jgi:hypothetical protein
MGKWSLILLACLPLNCVLFVLTAHAWLTDQGELCRSSDRKNIDGNFNPQQMGTAGTGGHSEY